MRLSALKINWAKVSFIANIVLIAGILIALGAAEVIHQSNTEPEPVWAVPSCGRIESYLTSNYLDNIHQQAGVECRTATTIPSRRRSRPLYGTSRAATL